MGMSYRRAWLLVDALDVAFGQPLVAKQRATAVAAAPSSPSSAARWSSAIAASARATSAGRADLEALTAALAGERGETPRRDVPTE